MPTFCGSKCSLETSDNESAALDPAPTDLPSGMAYDALAESIELIRTRSLTPVRRLSRRRRFAAMSVDVDGDVAVTAFVRRGVGCVWIEIHVLALREAGWVVLGGGGHSDRDDHCLDDRPVRLANVPWPASTAGSDASSALIAAEGAGGDLDEGGRTGRWPRSGRWISHATVLGSADVQVLTVADRRLTVPWHGRQEVVWIGRRRPRVTALDADDQPVGTVLLTP